jgi:hypothetical protein
MDDQAFDAMTRQAAQAVSRRGSLLTLGGAALAVSLFGPVMAEAKGGKKGNKCKKQVSRCKQGLPDLCAAFVQESNVQKCVDLFKDCCNFLEGCDAAKVIDCAIEKAEAAG